MKAGTRFLGVDDGPRELEKLIGVAYRGTEFMEQVEVVDQKVDEGEATQKIIDLYSKFDQYIAAILLDGISFNGFNIADIREISDRTETPVIAVTGNKPDKDAMKKGLEAAGLETEIVDRLPETQRIGETYVQFAGCGKQKAEEIVEKATLQGNIPEAIRAAHLIGLGLKQG